MTRLGLPRLEELWRLRLPRVKWGSGFRGPTGAFGPAAVSRPGHPAMRSRLTHGIKVQDVRGEQGESEAVTVLRVAEAEIGEDLSRQLQSLLQACFPGYPSRSYFKLPPHFRYVATSGDGVVTAQMGVELRVIRAGDLVVRTFGVVDLCVGGSERSRGLASTLLAEVTEFARLRHGLHHLVRRRRPPLRPERVDARE